MEMRSGGKAGIADVADDLALLDDGALLNLERAEMGVPGQESVLVLDDDVVSEADVEGDRDDLSGGGGQHRVA